MTSMVITPLTDKVFGAVVTNVHLADINESAFAEIHAAFLEYGFLVFPKQFLTEQQNIEFGERFGELEFGGLPLANQKKQKDGSYGVVIDLNHQRMRTNLGNEAWHTDSTYMPLASKAAMLTAVILPPENGETEFADMRAAWEALTPERQAALEGLEASHSLFHSQGKSGYQHAQGDGYGLHDLGAPRRAIVKVHPETGRKSIYTGRHAYGVSGMSDEESEALLTRLLEDACQPPRTYLHRWDVGDTVVWDNRCMMHRARPYDPSYPRTLRGSRIAGDPSSELAATVTDKFAAAQ